MGIDYVDVKNHCIDGECSRCGQCCGDYLPLLAGELEEIKRYVQKHNIKPHKNLVVSLPVDITCPFLNGKQECVIYKIRPSICRTFQCNMTVEEMKENKIHHHVCSMRSVSIREAVFNEPNPFDIYVKLLKDQMGE